MKEKISFLCIILILGIVVLKAQNIPKAPAKYTPINDFADLLSKTEEETLTNQLGKYEKAQTTQIVVVTISSLEGTTIENYANQLFNQWGIGQKGVDNGLLLLVAKNDRQMRIETGYGVEAYLTDLEAGQIIENILKPNFRKEKFGVGIELAIGEILKELGESDFKPILASRRKFWSYRSWLEIFSFLFLIIQFFLAGIFLKNEDHVSPSTVVRIISISYFIFILFLNDIRDPVVATWVLLAVVLLVLMLYLAIGRVIWMQVGMKYIALLLVAFILSGLLTATLLIFISLIYDGITGADLKSYVFVLRMLWGLMTVVTSLYLLFSGKMEEMITSGMFSGGGGSGSYSSSGSSSYSSSSSSSSSWGGGSSGGGGASGSW